MSTPSSTEGGRKKSNGGGGRFGGSDMQEHLARMGRQLAEIQAQHSQLFGGQQPNRENLAKATARYLTANRHESFTDFTHGQSNAEHVEQLAHRLLHRSPSSPPSSSGAFSGASHAITGDTSGGSTSTGAYAGTRLARSHTDDTDTAKSNVRRSLLWDGKEQLDDVAEGSTPSQSPSSSMASPGTQAADTSPQEHTGQSRARSGRSSSDSGASPDAASALAAKRLAVLQAYADQANSRKRHAESSGGAGPSTGTVGRSSSVASYERSGSLGVDGAAHAPSARRTTHDAEVVPEELVVAGGEGSEVRVYKYPRATRDADEDSDADSVAEEAELADVGSQQQGDLEFTFGSVLQGSVVLDEAQGEDSGSESVGGTPSQATTTSPRPVDQETPGSEWSSSPGERTVADTSPSVGDSPIGVSQLGSGLSRTLEVSLGGHANATAAIHAALGGASAGHYSVSFGPGKEGFTTNAGAGGATTLLQRASAGGGASIRPPLPPAPAGRRSTMDNAALLVSPGRAQGQPGAVPTEDSVLFGSPVHKDAYQAIAQHPLAPSGGQPQGDVARASYAAEPRVVLYEPSRYAESPDTQAVGASLLEQHVAAARAAAMMRLSSGGVTGGKSPAAPALASVPLPQLPTPTSWRAGAASPMAKAAAGLHGVSATSLLPFSPNSSPVAADTPYAASSMVSIPPTPPTDMPVFTSAAGLRTQVPSPSQPPADPEPASTAEQADWAQRSLHAAMDAARASGSDAAVPQVKPELRSNQPPLSVQPPVTRVLSEGMPIESPLGAWSQQQEPLQPHVVEEHHAPASKIPHAPGTTPAPAAPAVPAAAGVSEEAATSAPTATSPGHANLAKLSQLKLRRQQQWQHNLEAKQHHDAAVPSDASTTHKVEMQEHHVQHSPTKHTTRSASPSVSGSPGKRPLARRTSSPSKPTAQPLRRTSRDHGNVFSPLTLELREHSVSGGGSPESKSRRLSHHLDVAASDVHAAAGVVQHSTVSIAGLGATGVPQLPGGELGHGITGISSSFAPGLLKPGGAVVSVPGGGAGEVAGHWEWHPNISTPGAGSSQGYSSATPGSYGVGTSYGSESPPRRRRTADDTPIVVSPSVGGPADRRASREEEDKRPIRPYYNGRPSSGAHRTSRANSAAGHNSRSPSAHAATAPSPPTAPAAGALPASAPARDAAASGSQAPASRAAALLRLKQQRIQQQLHSAAPVAGATAPGPLGHTEESQGGARDASEGGNGDYNLRSRRGDSVPRAVVPRAAAAASASEAAGDGVPGTPDAGLDPNAKPFLKRRSKAVVGSKLDWSHVKPRTHSRMEDYIGGPTAHTPPRNKAAHAVKAASPVLRKHAGQAGGKAVHGGSGGGAGGTRNSGGWRPGGKQPSPPQDKVARVHARLLGGNIPGIDYEVQRYTGITTFSTTGTGVTSGGGAASRLGPLALNSPQRVGIRASMPSSPLDDLLAHVNTLLADFDTRFSAGNTPKA